MFLTGVFTRGDIEGQEVRVWWGGENAWKAGDWAHASSFLQTHRMRSAQPSTSLFIPAHAGNTDCYLHRMGAPEAHPRAYGEYDSRQQQEEAGHGSSPCIRGIPLPSSGCSSSKRLIPVHTGNTDAPPQASHCSPAHPRAYGEYFFFLSKAVRRFGSSPCIRGILLTVPDDNRVVRLIPVHTGNTECKPVGKDVPSAHPRAYGEYPYKLEQVI